MAFRSSSSDFSSAAAWRTEFWSAGGRLVPLEVMEWLPPVAKALDYLHRQGRLHRDVKPSNVLYDALGNVTLSDAGLVEALGSPDPRLLGLAAAPGTAAPIPPDPRPGSYSDQYALAAMVYRVLGGEMPFPTGGAFTLAENALPRVPPRAAQAVCGRCLSSPATDSRVAPILRERSSVACSAHTNRPTRRAKK
jgi:serine/threonine protein kinase